jgi:hypothetical protein
LDGDRDISCFVINEDSSPIPVREDTNRGNTNRGNTNQGDEKIPFGKDKKKEK